MAATSVKKAQELMAKGEKALTKFSFFGGGTAKFEDAAECFNDAGKQFVMGKAYGEGASAYRRAADCHLKAKSEFDAASSYGKAGEAFQKLEDVSGCSACFREAAAIYGGMGKCSMAANMSKKLAEVLENGGDPAELPNAIEAYGAAIDYYDGENQPMRANGCREKVAFLSATLGAYDDALAAFDSLGRSCLGSNLGKFNAKKWFTNAILCALAREDVVKAKNALAEYANLDYSFVGTLEHMLCEQLTAACEASSEEGVATAAAEYDKIKRLDPWMTKLLLAIKGTCEGMDAPPMPSVADEDVPDAPDEDDAEDLPDLT
ncbi:hypothetical protein JL721_8977 [Aureococcus anophagefferens]|nr:hypothetical protein JL721_8977 [Aureococcus anophagefferens]